LLLVVADLRGGFVRLPLGGGPESGLIVLSLAWFGGLAVSAAAALIAFLRLRRADRVRSSRWLLDWCCALVLGFGLVFVV
jgi:hypothetical protein